MRKIDKRSCYKAYKPVRQMNLNCGAIHEKEISYIVRTNVRNIGHQRLLVLHIYSREKVEKGDFLPKWTIFQSKDDYITLERENDGTTRWRTAAFINLDRGRWIIDQCAFYSIRDEKHISDFFHRSGDGLKILNRVQNDILTRRYKEKQRRKEQKIISRMKNIPPLPKGVESWVRKNLVPA